MRAKARLSVAGNESRDQHHGRQGRWTRRPGVDRRRQGRARAAARAGPERRIAMSETTAAGAAGHVDTRSDSPRRRGLLFVVSAPSGTGKTTLVERLAARTPGLRMSRSYTSRERRPGETDGVDYNFISRGAFEAMVARDEFLEWADVFG